MTCSTCQATKHIPQCTSQITLGVIDHKSTNVYIFVKNIITGYEARQDATSDADGVVQLDLGGSGEIDPNMFTPSHKYEVWVTLRDTSSTERLEVEIGGGTFTCFAIEFDGIVDTSGDMLGYTSHVLQLDSDYTTIAPLLDFDSKNLLLDESDTSKIFAWLDDSANDNHAVNSGGYAKPDVDVDALNGCDIVQATQTAFLDGLMKPLTYAGNVLHVMAVVKPTGTPNEAHGIFYDAHINLFEGHGVSIDKTSGELVYHWDHTPIFPFDTAETDGAGLLDGEYHVIEVLFNAGNLEMTVDTVPQQIATSANLPLTLPPTYGDVSRRTGIGFFGDLILGQEGGADIRAIKIWDKAMSATQRQEEQLRMVAMI